MADKKIIYAEDLLMAIRDDPNINGTNFARVKEHIEAAPEILIQNKPRFIVKPKKVSREELIALQNGPVILHTEDEHIVPICQDRWIPVTERLPEKKGDVLVCDTREDFVSTWEYLGNGLWLYDNIFWGTDDITHWMPLPEAPKGE